MLSIRNINKTYENGVRALSDVNLEIPQGMFGLLGPNGAGKSSLMRTISTLQDADSGTIEFDGVNVLKNPETLRKNLGYLPQDFGVYPRVSAEFMLDHMAILKGIKQKNQRRELVGHLLQQTNLYEVRKKNISTFSGGMKQRWGIAQALIGNPKLIVVDEPTAGLDPTERIRFHNLLCEIGENVVVILSTHIVDDVADLCPNMAILNKGSVTAKGNPIDLIDGVKGKIWERTFDRKEVEGAKANWNVISTQLQMGKTIVRVFSEDCPDSSFSPAKAGLEDVYFSRLSEQSEVHL